MSARLSRRACLGGLAVAALGCRRTSVERDRPTADAASSLPGTPAVAPSDADAGAYAITELSFDATPVGAEKAVMLVPRWGDGGERFPVLVALHGRGEAVRGVDAGAYGWLRDYGLGRAIERLRSPPLSATDFAGFVDERRLDRINASLRERPFRGLVVVCPWVPDLLTDRDRNNLDAAVPFGDFVVDHLLARARSASPALEGPASTGIDGVSLGGRVALLVGLAHGDRFGAVGTLQPAVQEREARSLSQRATAARTLNPKLKVRLLTSDKDYFRGPVAALSEALASARLDHEHLVVVGPHDYAFNRGPGGVEMLLWHDRVLRGESSV